MHHARHYGETQHQSIARILAGG